MACAVRSSSFVGVGQPAPASSRKELFARCAVELEAKRQDLARRVSLASVGDRLEVRRSAEAAENAQAIADRDTAAGGLSRDYRQLKDVLAAQQRLRDYVFGYCEDCAEEISSKRLAALPAASKCIACAEAQS